MEYMAIIKMIAPWVIAGATAFGGVKVGLNGQRNRLNGLDRKLEGHLVQYNKDSRTIVRTLASLETKVDLLVDNRIRD
ncbi:hypothetical protein LCGC14_2508710 [marine sediment metagenome]|uniref:Uncharacterized protein n=1 Tax=marine sediment metagenome TaxID=412755 RepID=A0A0F9BMN5_9ZZZZ